MDELTLGLIGAGAVVVGGVVVYNAWQGAKVRRKMPRPMPADAAENFARDDHQEQSPFIEPARPTTRREPVVGAEASADTASARVEPTFGAPVGAAPLDTPADIQAETTTPNGYLSDGDDAEAEGGAKASSGADAGKDAAAGQQPASNASREADEQIEPILPAATTIS
ncbi:MAG: cell division protein FtsZ, partial [Paraburkholderia caledonica]